MSYFYHALCRILRRIGESGEAVVSVEDRALERYKLIEPFLQGARTLASIAAQADVNLRTAQRWVDLYRRNGLEALSQKQRVDRGTKRAMSQRMVETIEGLALEKPRVPISAIYRELKEFASKTGERLPSYPAVYRVVKAIPISLMTLAHSGSRMYCERFDLVHRREAARPMPFGRLTMRNSRSSFYGRMESPDPLGSPS